MSYPPMTAPLIPLRPLTISDLFTSTFAIYKRNFGQFIVLGLIPSIIGTIVALGAIGLFAAALVPMIISLTSNGDYGSIGASVGLLTLAGLAVVVGSLVSTVASLTATGMISLGAVQVNRGLRPTARSLWRDSRGLPGRSLGLVGLGLAAGLAVSIGFGVLLVLGIRLDAWWLFLLVFAVTGVFAVIVLARLGLVTQVLAIEGQGAITTVKNCWRLTEGSGARILGLMMLASILVNFAIQSVNSIIQGLTGTLGGQFTVESGSMTEIAMMLAAMVPMLLAGSMVSLAAGVVAQPFLAIYAAVLYVDQVRRKQAQFGQPLFA